MPAVFTDVERLPESARAKTKTCKRRRSPHPTLAGAASISVCFRGRDLPGILPLFALVDVLGEIDADAHFFDHAELGFEPVDMLFFVDEDLFE